MNKTLRKIRKLFRSPKQYWIDSKLKKHLSKSILFRNSFSDGVRMNADVGLISPSANQNSICASLSKDTGVCISIEPITKTALSRDNLLYLKQEDFDTQIEIKILESDDVTQFKQKNYLGYNLSDKLSSEITVESIVDSLTQSQKDFFASFKFILLINPSSKLIYAIRHCSFKPRIILVVTKEDCLSNINKDYIDDLIVTNDISNLLNINEYRNIEICQNQLDAIYECIRYRMRELSSKDYNLFIPIKKTQPNKILKLNSYSNYDYLIKANLNLKGESKTFESLLKFINIDELYMREELIFRYKHLIRHCQQINNYEKLLKFTTFDGYKCYELN